MAAVANGALRETLYKQQLGDLAAHQVSTATGILLFTLIMWVIFRTWPLRSARQAWSVGGTWLILTIGFEFGFGHFVMGHSWGGLFHDYNPLEGRVWVFVLLWTTIGPYIFWRFGHRGVPEAPGRSPT